MHDDDLRYMVEGYMGRVTMVQCPNMVGIAKGVGRRLEWQAGKAKNVERKGKELGAKPPFPSVVRYSPAIRRPRSRLP
uniref:Uncharacterized protein n=1 Tax=Vespula pensylvanica TaxID=30213 RepID=A0A834P1B1_VESPE|nr:hypothetical protein H0235_007471 [Vespula pensylvanica]